MDEDETTLSRTIELKPGDLNDDIIDELTSIVVRVSDLIQLATTGQYNSRGYKQIAKRLRSMGKCKEAKELEMLMVRAKELRSVSRIPD